MATSELVRPEIIAREVVRVERPGARVTAVRALSALASLRLTVVLFALSIFLVFAGTLAQVDQGVWDVVNHTYFRVWIAQVDLLAFERLVQMFAPSVNWNLTGGFYFPGGKLLGGLLLANLLAAHGVRFKVAAEGVRLWSGLAIIAAGVAITAAVITSGMNDTVESELTPAFCNALWQALRATLVGLVLVGAYVLVLSHGSGRRTEWYLLLSVVGSLGAVAVWLFLNPEARLDDSGLRILWQLVKGTAAGGVLLTGCVLAFRKRAGVVLLHGGVALMMASELITGLTANEAQMTITEGESTNFASDIRTVELAVIDRSAADEDSVTVVPRSLLTANVGAAGRIEHRDLPVAIQVHRWLPNSELRAAAGGHNPATAGAGLRFVAGEVREGTGVDNKAAVDQPAAYVELFSNDTGRSLGTYLVAPMLLDQSFDVDGRTYDLALRFKRQYFPYQLALQEFRFDRYMGTNTPKNYSSRVVLTDPARNVDRELLISMNNPLRYDGTTYYQADFDKQTEKTTVLQVVENPGWMVPYVACMLVAIGMLAHFGVTLTRFLRRRASEVQETFRQPASGPQLAHNPGAWAAVGKWFPAVVVVIFAVYLGGKARLPKSEPNAMQIQQFAKLPLAYQGRIKPYDTVARNTLQILSGRQEVIGDGKPGWLNKLMRRTEKAPAIVWLLDMIADAADDHRVFRIENLELLQTLGLEPREGSWRYSIREIRERLAELDKQIALAAAQPEAARSAYQRAVLGLASKLNRYAMLVQSFRSPDLTTDRDQFAASLEQVHRTLQRLRLAEAPHAVPPREVGGRWMPVMEAELQLLHDRVTNQPFNPATIALSTMLDAYARGDATTFNKHLADYRNAVGDYEEALAAEADQLKSAGMANAEILSQRRINFEVFYNQFSPFYYAAVLYVAAFMLAAFSWLGWTEPLRKASIWLLWLTFALHTFALVARIDISGRPPVTNLYSSAVFIGWACVLMALVFESIYRLGLGNIVASVIGFLTLLVAHFLSLDGDTFVVLQAVLDTQFWLATHVVCITLGYSTTFLAGALGVLYVLLVHVFPALDEPQRRQLTRMTYGTLCFAIFFSFVGTVLGGLWADDSWGRFWGWDPKENGALIIVLYNALVLHARWGGLVGGRGLALLAIGGNVVTTWSWFGVNELGVGLHAYGGSDSNTAMWLLTFAASQLAVIILGSMPQPWFTRLRAQGSAPGIR